MSRDGHGDTLELGGADLRHPVAAARLRSFPRRIRA
jgi:hypothetical protein